VPASVRITPENDRTFHAKSHDSGAALVRAMLEVAARKWGMQNPADRADYWLRWPGTGWTSVKRFGYPASRDFSYFIRFELPAGEQPIKIGVAKHPYSRLSSLRCGSPYPMTLLAVYPDELLPEVQLHAAFADSRLNGEWFAPTPLLLEVVTLLATAHPLNHSRLRGGK
jgi:hypothetical protein